MLKRFGGTKTLAKTSYFWGVMMEDFIERLLMNMGLLIKCSSKAGQLFLAAIIIVVAVALAGAILTIILPTNATTKNMIITATNTGPAFFTRN